MVALLKKIIQVKALVFLIVFLFSFNVLAGSDCPKKRGGDFVFVASQGNKIVYDSTRLEKPVLRSHRVKNKKRKQTLNKRGTTSPVFTKTCRRCQCKNMRFARRS